MNRGCICDWQSPTNRTVATDNLHRRLFSFTFQAGLEPSVVMMCIHRGNGYYEMGAGPFFGGGLFILFAWVFFVCIVLLHRRPDGAVHCCSFLLLVEAKKVAFGPAVLGGG